MSTVSDYTDVYAAQFRRDVRRREGELPAWLRRLRESALAEFTQRGFPTLRDEEWRHTNVKPLVETQFEAPDPDGAHVTPGRISPFRLGTGNEAALVFVNGRFAERLSDAATWPQGVRVMSLARALAADLPAVQDHLARYAGIGSSAFVALNTAFAEQGAFIEIPPGVVLETPIHLLFVSCADERPIVAHPRNLIMAGANSQFSVIEHYIALDDGVYFNNAVTELVAAENVIGAHCKVVRESDRAYHVATLQVHQDRDSQVSSQTVCLGGGLVRNDINPVLAGAGARCNLEGLYMLAGSQHADNHLRVEHRSPHTSSREFFRGVLDGRSRGVFCGRIIVRPGAQKTDAKQTNMNLLLSELAQVDTKPQLEILADDVKCTHGATIGQLDADAIFYLRARGIAEEAARSLLVYAFANASLEAIRSEPVRRQLRKLVTDRLPYGDSFREFC